jgi:hypothetical protein
MLTTTLRFEANARTECGIRNCLPVRFSIDVESNCSLIEEEAHDAKAPTMSR